MKSKKIWRFVGGKNKMMQFVGQMCTVRQDEDGRLWVYMMNHTDCTFKTTRLVSITNLDNGWRIVHTASGSCYEFELVGKFMV